MFSSFPPSPKSSVYATDVTVIVLALSVLKIQQLRQSMPYHFGFFGDQFDSILTCNLGFIIVHLPPLYIALSIPGGSISVTRETLNPRPKFGSRRPPNPIPRVRTRRPSAPLSAGQKVTLFSIQQAVEASNLVIEIRSCRSTAPQLRAVDVAHAFSNKKTCF